MTTAKTPSKKTTKKRKAEGEAASSALKGLSVGVHADGLAEIQNLKQRDWFAESDDDEDGRRAPPAAEVHIHVQQRGGRKAVTTATGMPGDLDLRAITKALRKLCRCNGSAKKDKKWGDVVILQGDQRQKLRSFLIEQEICLKEQIIVHGY